VIHDLEKIDNNFLNTNYDICIVGAGAAGITLANKLSDKGLNVILCEAGSDEYSEVSQKNYIGKIKGDPYFDLDIARLRYLGGTTNHWNGMCRPFEKIELTNRCNNIVFICFTIKKLNTLSPTKWVKILLI